MYKITTREVKYLINDGIVSGGMIPKVDCCIDALQKGVTKTHIIDGRIPHTILLELFSELGVGTMIEMEEY
ncbi:MAG: hypothetical protein ACRCX8_17180 [Sarcina sp.]